MLACRLGEYDFSIYYKPGSTGTDADLLSKLHERSRDKTLSGHISDITCDQDMAWMNYMDVTELDPDNLDRVNVMTTGSPYREYQQEDPDLYTVRELLKSNVKLVPKDCPCVYRHLFYHKDNLSFDENDVLMKKVILEGLDYNLVVLPRRKMSWVLQLINEHSGCRQDS